MALFDCVAHDVAYSPYGYNHVAKLCDEPINSESFTLDASAFVRSRDQPIDCLSATYNVFLVPWTCDDTVNILTDTSETDTVLCVDTDLVQQPYLPPAREIVIRCDHIRFHCPYPASDTTVVSRKCQDRLYYPYSAYARFAFHIKGGVFT
jgi:hypothetical protein